MIAQPPVCVYQLRIHFCIDVVTTNPWNERPFWKKLYGLGLLQVLGMDGVGSGQLHELTAAAAHHDDDDDQVRRRNVLEPIL